MSNEYDIITLSSADRDRLERVYADLFALSSCAVPSVRSAARAALADIAQALNGQGMAYELYSAQLSD